MLLTVFTVSLAALSVADYYQAVEAGTVQTLSKPVFKRSPNKNEPHSMMHSHLSRKVFDRACAASKDTIDEVVACITGNEHLIKAVKEEDANKCYKDAFGADFNPKEVLKHKELICNNREKFEEMTTCIYRKTAEALDKKEMDKLAESMVDVGLCIINALDG